jgi:hypothetical protein
MFGIKVGRTYVGLGVGSIVAVVVSLGLGVIVGVNVALGDGSGDGMAVIDCPHAADNINSVRKIATLKKYFIPFHPSLWCAKFKYR